MNPWTLAYEGFDPASEWLREVLCTLGNGRFATRGATPDGEVRTPGTYAAGCYDRLASTVAGRTVTNEDLVNLPDWLPLTFATPVRRGSARSGLTCWSTARSSTCGRGCCCGDHAGATRRAASPSYGNAVWCPWPTRIWQRSKPPSPPRTGPARFGGPAPVTACSAFLEVLEPEECLRLVAPGGVGRVAFNGSHGPTVLPVNYKLHDGAIVFRTAYGGPMDQDLRTGQEGVEIKIGFEVDRMDEIQHEGWSVLIQGAAHHVSADELAKVPDSDVTPWAGGDRQLYIRIIPHQITGRRIHGR
ncbi:pyridoxamine 5'-phosphate oxidase family protein [Nonomuraea guangzhouensis]|uniref:pyridoxamine 5'-phosphate oxidase family protein n=1 Tax=Nonomuraea guangzhouensis TaxID=1291555 RepID=UPI003FD7D9D8